MKIEFRLYDEPETKDDDKPVETPIGDDDKDDDGMPDSIMPPPV